MSEVILKATQRSVIGKQVKALRRVGQVPAVIFGRNIEGLPVSLDARETVRILRGLTSSQLITIEVEGAGKHTALLRERQYHPVKGNLLHLDFQAVSMDEKLVVTIPVRLMGTASVVKEHNAMLMTELDTLEVEAFPGDLPEYIDVNIDSLVELGDTITVASLNLGDKVEIRHAPDEVIVIAISAEAEEIQEEISAGGAEPELVSRGKAEEEDEE